MLYHAAMIFMMVEINPRTQTEIFAAAVLFVLSAIINALIFGQFAVLTEVWGRKAQEFQDRFDGANSAMQHLDLETEVESQVRLFITGTHWLKSQQ